MKHIYSIGLFLLVFFSACGQKKEQPQDTEEMQTVLVEKYTEKIWSEMKHYEVQPAYYLRVYQANCTFQVLVNGLNAFSYHGLEKLGSAESINRFILKSGKQEVTVRMYPLGTLLQEEYGEENYEDILTLLPQSNVEVKVTQIANLKTYESPSKDEKVVVLHNSPKDAKDEFIGKGLPYYEYSFEFDAVVPYEFEGWTNGVDLSTVDQEELKKQFLIQNDRLRQLYMNKDGEKILNTFSKNLIREFESQYFSIKDIKSELKLLSDVIFIEKEIIIVENENLDYDFTTNNKLISQWVTNDLIKSRNLEFKKSRGYTNIIFIDDLGMGNCVYNYFYMPKEYEGKEIHLEYMP